MPSTSTVHHPRSLLRLSVKLELERCVICSRVAPLPNADLCADCTEASRYVTATGSVGVCPICLNYDHLFESDLLSREFSWCHQHSVIATARMLPQTDRTVGDVRNISA